MAKAAEGEAAKGGGKRKLLLLSLPLLLVATGGGLWFSGILPKLLGHPEEHPAAAEATEPAQAASRPPVFFDMPEIIANLNAPGRRGTYIRLRSKLELSRPEDAAVVQAAMPRLLDLYTTYLREMRPEDCAAAPARSACGRS